MLQLVSGIFAGEIWHQQPSADRYGISTIQYHTSVQCTTDSGTKQPVPQTASGNNGQWFFSDQMLFLLPNQQCDVYCKISAETDPFNRQDSNNINPSNTYTHTYRLQVHRLSADNRYQPMQIIGRLFYLLLNFLFISILIISLHYYEFMTHELKLIHTPFEWMRKWKCFSVVRHQDSGTVRAGPNWILEFPRGRNLFILHRLLNTGMGWAGP